MDDKDKLTMKEAIKYLGINQVKFYQLRDQGLIPDGSQKRKGTQKMWSKSALAKARKGAGLRIAKPNLTSAEIAVNAAFNVRFKTQA